MAKSPLSNWYGYDKIVEPAAGSYTEGELYFRRTYSGRHNLSHEFANVIKRTSDDNVKRNLARLYMPPADGVTEEDFLKFIESYSLSEYKGSYYTWRAIIAMNKSKIQYHSSSHNYSVRGAYSSFFSVGKRTDQLFRIIEINEFLHHTDSENITFAEFLETNKEVAEKAKNLILEEKDIPLENYFGYRIPDFLTFPSRLNMKTRDLLLPLTKDQMHKLYDWETNPYREGSNGGNSCTFDFVKLYIGAATGEITAKPLKTLDETQVQNAISLALIKETAYWEKVSEQRGAGIFLIQVLDELMKISYNTDAFKRNFAYLVHEGVLEKLDAKEIVGLVLGFEKSHRWIETSKGKSTLEQLTEIMQEGKLDPVHAAKLIAHIVNSHLQPIVFDPDFDWSIVDDTLPAWLYQVLPHSEKKQALKRPLLSEIMGRY